MINCPKCSAITTPGASDCVGCGYVFSATESNPGFSPEKVFNWWLVFYAFWRLWALATNGVAAMRALDGASQFFFVGSAVLALLSLTSIGLLWRRRKLGLYAFLCVEVVTAVWLLLFGQYGAAPYPLIAAVIMWIVSRRTGNVLR